MCIAISFSFWQVSRMRVIAGIAKGRKLVAPRGTTTRPVLDQVKEAIFNILFDVSDLRVLDLFAGTGSVGIEALSRGSTHCTFVESDRAALDAIRTNIDRCGFSDITTILPFSVAIALKRRLHDEDPFDLIFVDPPYERNLVNPTLHLLVQTTCVGPSTRIIIEHHPHELIDPPPGLALTDERAYGQTRVSFLRRTS